MKYSEYGFRPLYHNFCIFPLTDKMKEVVGEFPGIDVATGMLTYGYIDRDCGLTLEVLCLVKITDEQYGFFSGNENIRATIRIGAVEDEEFEFLGYGNDEISKNYMNKLDMLKAYDADESVEESRSLVALDAFRHEYYVDDVLVVMLKENLDMEGCWVHIVGLEDGFITGILLNEPNQDFGCHKGDKIAFGLYERSDGTQYLGADLDEV